jgi:CRISPR-associated endonuclease/helicase Cas3
LAEAQVLLVEPEIGEESVPNFGKSEFVYARYVLLRSYIVLNGVQAIRLPEDLEQFVEQVYGNDHLVVPKGWEEDLQKSRQKLKEKQDTQQLDALNVAICDPNGSPLEQQSHQLEDDDPEASKRIQAQTRDADPSMQLIVVYQIYGRDFLDPDGTVPFDENLAPVANRIRRILDNEVTINHAGCLRNYVATPVPAGWRKCGMLRYHRIVRIGPGGESATDAWILLDRNLGIVFKKRRDEEVD